MRYERKVGLLLMALTGGAGGRSTPVPAEPVVIVGVDGMRSPAPVEAGVPGLERWRTKEPWIRALFSVSKGLGR